MSNKSFMIIPATTYTVNMLVAGFLGAIIAERFTIKRLRKKFNKQLETYEVFVKRETSKESDKVDNKN